LGTREGTRGRYSKGYIVGISDSVEQNVNIIASTEEYFHFVYRKNELILEIIFVYIPPGSTTQMSSIFNILNPDIANCIILGDFNARIGRYQSPCHNNYQIRASNDIIINSRGRELIRCMEENNMVVLNGCTSSDPTGNFSFCSKNGSSTIDLAICNSDLFQLLDFEVLEEIESHHFPIVTRIEGKTFKTQITSVKKIIWDPTKSDNFRKSLDEIFQTLDFRLDVETFSKSLIKAAEANNIITIRRLGDQHNEYGPKWFDSSCLQKKSQTRKLLREYRKCNDSPQKSECKSAYLRSARYYNNYIRAKRLKFLGHVDSKLCDSKNPRDFFSALNYYRPKNSSYGSKEHVSPTKFESFYSDLFSCDSLMQIETVPESSIKDSMLDSEFDFHELNLVIKNLSRKKAPGPDCIVNELWISLSPSQRLMLLDCINECWRNKEVPQSWSEIVISPIYKKGQKDDPSNYRPISLVNTCLKLLTSLMTNRLNSWCDSNKTISEYQAAYKKGTGCEDHVFTLSAIIQNQLKYKKNVMYALFIDLTKAFDSINHQKLWSKLYAAGLSSHFISMIQIIYRNARAKIRTSHGESEYFQIKKGILQGECLSAKLFTLFMDDLVNILHQSDIPSLKIVSKEIHMLLYADDIVVLATNIFDLQSKINLISKYFRDNDLNVNLNKTKVIMFKYGKARKVKPKVFWDDNEIEFVDEYLYLGVPFYSNFSSIPVSVYFIKKAKCAENQLFNLFYRSKIKTLPSRTKLYNCLVKSMLSYCCSIWGIENIDKLEVFQNNFIRRMLNVPRNAPNWFIRLESNVMSIRFEFIKNLLLFYNRLLHKPRDSLVWSSLLLLKKHSSHIGMKYNWYRSLRALAVEWNFLNILDLECLNSTDLVYEGSFQKIMESISQTKSRMQQLEIESMNASKSMPLYKEIRTHVREESFMLYPISWAAVNVIIQLRSNLSRLMQINLRALGFFFNQCDDALCLNCTLNEIENCFHVMFRCPKYSRLRTLFLAKYQLPETQEKYYEFFQEMDKEKVKLIHAYVKCMLDLRST
jgi:hypothetical protein